jgi:hypothetical protein
MNFWCRTWWVTKAHSWQRYTVLYMTQTLNPVHRSLMMFWFHLVLVGLILNVISCNQLNWKKDLSSVGWHFGSRPLTQKVGLYIPHLCKPIGNFWGFFFLFFFAVLGLELKASGTLPLEPLSQSCFVLGIFEIGSYKLFAQNGFELGSSWSLPPQ